jgi:hypothetical protein
VRERGKREGREIEGSKEYEAEREGHKVCGKRKHEQRERK